MAENSGELWSLIWAVGDRLALRFKLFLIAKLGCHFDCGRGRLERVYGRKSGRTVCVVAVFFAVGVW